MLYNYLKTGWRSFTRGRLYSFINVIGLTLGTGVVILLSSFIKDEWTFEKFHIDHDRIYRLWVKEHVDGEVFFNTVTPFILGPQLKDHLPDIEAMARYVSSSFPVRLNDDISSQVIFLADPEFLDIFNFPLIEGEKNSFQSNPRSIILSNSTAKKFFGNKQVIGETIEIQFEGEWTSFQIAGLTGDPPSNSGFQYDILLPMVNADRLYSSRAQNSWTNVFVETFIKLNPENNSKKLEDKVVPFIDNQVKEIYAPGEYEVGFQPLTDIHLNNEFPAGILPVSDGRYPYILAAIALLILLLAAINFTTLAIGRSLKRSKEVGIRKTAGASRWQLMLQFWSEAILTSGVSVLFGIGLALVLLPKFNEITDKSLQLPFKSLNIIFIFLLAIMIGLLSGIYPSLVLSKVNPIKSLRGSKSSGGQMPKYLILRSLIGFQFVLSVLLICCTLIMRKQINFLQSANLGYAKDQVVIIPFSKPAARLSEVIAEATQNVQILENQLLNDQDLEQISISNHTFGSAGWTNLGFTDQNSQKYENFRMNGIDENFIPLHKIVITEGRNFEGEKLIDRRSVIINKAFSQRFNVSVNQILPAPFQEFIVIGITDDFNYQSLHQKVEPLVLCLDPIAMIQSAPDVSFLDYPNPKISIKVLNNISSNLTEIEKIWKTTTELPFSFSFLDENINRQYKAEQKLSLVIGIATLLAIVIASLGLFGMVTLIIAQKAREIAIRKVLGAGIFNIVFYFNRKFSLMIGLACLAAAPLSLFVMNQWLQDFAYRITPGIWLFIIAGLAAFLIATITISFQSIRAASVNPIKSIHAE